LARVKGTLKTDGPNRSIVDVDVGRRYDSWDMTSPRKTAAMDEPPIYYGETSPNPALSRYVSCFWHWRVSRDVQSFTHSIPPDGSVSLWFLSGMGFGVMGPQTQPLRVPGFGGQRIWGVRFWPGVAAAFLPFRSEDLRNGMRLSSVAEIGDWLEPLRAVFGGDPSELEAARAWESVLPAPLAHSSLDAAALSAVAEILRSRGDVAIAELGGQVGLSPRQLRRRFRAATGLNPKELARIVRVRSSLFEALFRAEWASLAFDHGFADQSHMAHEYQRLVGDAPSGLLRYLRTIRHSLNDSADCSSLVR